MSEQTFSVQTIWYFTFYINFTHNNETTAKTLNSLVEFCLLYIWNFKLSTHAGESSQRRLFCDEDTPKTNNTNFMSNKTTIFKMIEDQFFIQRSQGIGEIITSSGQKCPSRKGKE